MTGGTLSTWEANEKVAATITCVEGGRVEHDQVIATVAELKVELVELIGVWIAHLNHFLIAWLSFKKLVFLHAPQEPTTRRISFAMAESRRLITTSWVHLLGSCLAIIYVHPAVRIAKAVSVNIKVTHIFTCHVPIGNINLLIAHFTPNIDSLEKVTASTAQFCCCEELQWMLKSALIYFRPIIIVNNTIEVIYLRREAAFVLGYAALGRI